MVDLTLPNSIAGVAVSIALLSRDEEELRSLLTNHAINVQIAARSGDLQLFVSEEIEKSLQGGMLEVSSIDLKDTILARLVNGAQGM